MCMWPCALYKFNKAFSMYMHSLLGNQKLAKK